MTTYYVSAKNEIQAVLLATRKYRAREKAGVWLGHVTTQALVWAVTFHASGIRVSAMHEEVTQTITKNVALF